MAAPAPRADSVSGASVGEHTFLKRPQHVVAVAPAVCGEMEQERSAHCVVAGEQKRARIVSFDVKVRESFAISNVAVLALPVPQHLKPRVSTEHGTKPAVAPFSRGKDDARTMAAKRRPEAVAAAKRRKTAAPNQEPEPKRACLGFDVKSRGKESGVPASATERLNKRMEAELDALVGLLKKAALLSRSVPPAVKADARIAAAKRQPEAPSATKARNSTTSKPAPEVTKQSTQPKKQHPVAVQRAAPRAAKSSMASHTNKAQEVMEKQQLEEIARAREKFRQELLEVEKAAMPDETIYPEDLKELGISEYDVTPTKKQASLGSG